MPDLPALDGLNVLDLSRVLAGPWASQTLADLGADVIKVERPGVGDDTRAWGPPFFETPDGPLSAYYLSANRGKRSVAIDLATTDGQALVRSLALEADILIENFKVGDMARRGLGWPDLEAINPRLIYCSITGFGQTGPYRERPGYDFMIQAMAGLMSITGEPDSRSSDGPQKVGVAVADVFTGLYGTIAILAALAERERSGKGQHIDMALLDTQVAVLANQGSNFLVSGDAPGRLGNAHPNVVPYQTFRTSDGHIIVAVGNDAQFRRLCAVVERPELADEARYLDNAARVENRETLGAVLQEALEMLPSDHWLEVLTAASVPCGPINTIDQVFADEQVKARELRVEIDGVPGTRNPIRMSRSPLAAERPPPHLGADTSEVLKEILDTDDATLERLRATGVIPRDDRSES